MLMFFLFLLNVMSEVGEFGICLWMYSRSNYREAADMWWEMCILDEVLGDVNLLLGVMMSMVVGDFVVVYGEVCEIGMWDVVVTCFFIDIAYNIVEYLECIVNCLCFGGCWVNFGLLFYYWEEYVDE